MEKHVEQEIKAALDLYLPLRLIGFVLLVLGLIVTTLTSLIL